MIKTKLIGRESDVVPGRFGEPLQITHVQYSRGGGNTAPKRPLFPVPARLGVERDGLGRHDALRRAIQRFRLVARAADVAAGWPLCHPARTRGCMIVWIPARIWTVTHSPQRKQSTGFGEHSRRPCRESCRSVFRRAVCWRFTCCACTRNATRRRFRCPVFLRPALLREPRRRTIAWLTSTFRRSAMAERYRDPHAGTVRDRRVADGDARSYGEKLSWARPFRKYGGVQRFARLACRAQRRARHPVDPGQLEQSD